MRRFIFYWFTFKLVCCCGPCPCFARKCYPERTVAQGSTCYKYRQPSSFFIATVHQHPFTGNVVSGTALRGKIFCYTFLCQWYKDLRISFVDADETGKRRGLTCSLAHCNQKQCVERKQYMYLQEWFCQIVRSASWNIPSGQKGFFFLFLFPFYIIQCSCMSFSRSAP